MTATVIDSLPQLPPLDFSRLSFSQVSHGDLPSLPKLNLDEPKVHPEPSRSKVTPDEPKEKPRLKMKTEPVWEPTAHIQPEGREPVAAALSENQETGPPRPPAHDERYRRHPAEPSPEIEAPEDPEGTSQYACPSRVTTTSDNSDPSSPSTGSSETNSVLPFWLLVCRTRLELALNAIPSHMTRPNLDVIRNAALRSISSLVSSLSQPEQYPTAKPEAGYLWDEFFKKNASLVALCHDANSKDRRGQEEANSYILEEYHSLLSNVQTRLPQIWRDAESWIWCAWKAMWQRVDNENTAPVTWAEGSFGPIPTSAKSDEEYGQFLWLLTHHDSNHGLQLLEEMFSRMRETTSAEFHPPSAQDSLYSLPVITRLDPRRCRVRPVPIDAHCQFRSIADQLSSSGMSIDHRRVRSEVVEWLRGHASFSLGNNRAVRDMANVPTMTDWNAYCDRFKDGKEAAWGNVLTLQAAAQMYRRQILVVSGGGQREGGGGEVRQILPFSGMAAELAGSLYLWHWNSWCFGSCYIQ